VTRVLPATRSADDARLLNLIRAGDIAAYGTLFERHEPATRRLAGELASSPAEVDVVVSETFGLVLALTQRGGGPADAFRPYILTALRRVQAERLRYLQDLPPADDLLLADPGALFLDSGLEGLADALIVRAFLSLPGRWCAALWHLEIERAVPASVAPLLGLTRHSVATVSRRAKAGLRQAYLHLYAAGLTEAGCQAAAERLGAFITDSLSVRETGEVSGHLAGCTSCQAACTELADLSTTLRASVGSAILGTATMAYLSGSETDSVPGQPASVLAVDTPATLALVAPGGAGAAVTTSPCEAASPADVTGLAGQASPGPALWPAAAEAGLADQAAAAGAGPGDRQGAGAQAGGESGGRGDWPQLTAWATWAARPSRRITTAAAAVILVAAVAFAVVLSSHAGPAGHATGDSLALTPSAAATTAGLQPQPSPASTPPRHRQHHAKPRPSVAIRTSGASAQPGGTPASSPAQPAAASLTTAISVTGSGQRFRGDQITYEVSDTGTAGTGEVSVTISLPAGSWALGGGRHRGGYGGASGWSCQPAAAGITCQHAAIAAGSQAAGTLFLAVTSSGACGQPVQITATSGGVAASAQSQGIPC
jgi:DNA-directed RNA polymerase specialized sigma24 family protein